jgi:WD40 repeat protein
MPQAPAPAAPPAAKADPKLAHVAAGWQHSSPFISCRFDPKGRFVFAGAQDNTVQRFDAASGQKVALAGAHDSWVRAMEFSPDGETVFTGGYDGRLTWWPAAAPAPTPQRKIDAHSGWLRSIAVSPDGKLLATGGNDHLVKLWNASDGALVRAFAGHDRHVYSTLFHPGGQLLLSGDLRGVVKLWEVATGKEVGAFDAKDLYTPNPGQAAEYGGVRTMALSPDGKHLACGGLYNGSNPFGAVQDPLVLVFEWESKKKVQSHVTQGALKGIAWRVVYHPEGFLIGASGGSAGGFLLFWKLEAANEFHRFQLPNTALDMDLCSDGLRVATAHYDRHVRITRLAAKA